MLELHSAIPGDARRVSVRGAEDLVIEMLRPSRWVQLCVYPGAHAQAAAVFRSALGSDLPVSTDRYQVDGVSRVYRTAKDHYWLRDFSQDRIEQFAARLPAEAGAIVDLSDSRVTIRVAGRSAREVLSQWITVDLHPTVFQEGQFAQTGLHHVGGLLERNASDDYAYVALRTYALTVWDALTDLAPPYV